MTSNQIAYWQLQEQKRANLMNEHIKTGTLQEQHRANVAREGLEHRSLNIRKSEVEARQINDAISTGLKVFDSVGNAAKLFI